MKKLISVLLIIASALLILFLLMAGYIISGENKSAHVRKVSIPLEGELSELTEPIKVLVKNTDSEKVSEAIDFIKEKADNGELDSKREISNVIEEAEDKFNIVISNSTKKEITEGILKLEDMGFSSEIIAGEISDLYDEYGNDFTDHLEEAFVEAAKEAAGNVVQKTWDNAIQGIKEAIAEFFD